MTNLYWAAKLYLPEPRGWPLNGGSIVFLNTQLNQTSVGTQVVLHFVDKTFYLYMHLLGHPAILCLVTQRFSLKKVTKKRCVMKQREAAWEISTSSALIRYLRPFLPHPPSEWQPGVVNCSYTFVVIRPQFHSRENWEDSIDQPLGYRRLFSIAIQSARKANLIRQLMWDSPVSMVIDHLTAPHVSSAVLYCLNRLSRLA